VWEYIKAQHFNYLGVEILAQPEAMEGIGGCYALMASERQ
jgi:hypothetical protein